MKNEKGFSLVEVLIALALLGIIAAAFLGGIATASKAILIADKRTTAESLARSQMEYVKNQSYIDAADGGEAIYNKIADEEIPDGYTIWGVNRTPSPVEDILGVPWDTQNNQPVTADVGLQRIKLIIKHNGDEVITLEDYKVER